YARQAPSHQRGRLEVLSIAVILPLSRLARVPCRGAPEQVRRFDTFTGPFEIFGRPSPLQLVNRGEHGNVDSKCRESAKQQRIVPASEKRLTKGTRSPQRRVPVLPVFWNIFQMWILRQNCGCGFGPPSRNTGIAVCRVADHS